MEASTVPQIEKREFKNQTAGWLGVVVIDARGEEKGVSIEPYGTVWLSPAEVTLTSRAPRLAADNPFEEQTFIGVDADGQRGEFKMRPLVPADGDPRYVPSQDRYVPPPPSTPAEAVTHAAAAAQDRVVTSPEASTAEAAILASPPLQGAVAGFTASPQAAVSEAPTPAASPPQPSSTGSALGASTAPAPEPETGAEGQPERQSWTEDPPAPGEVLPGTLRGSDEPAPAASAAAAPDPTQRPAEAPVVPPQSPAPPAPPTAPEMTREELAGGIRGDAADTFGSAAASPAEEHAVVDPAIGEETGAAVPPAGAPPEGEFAAQEEVGSPDAPAASRASESEAPAEG